MVVVEKWPLVETSRQPFEQRPLAILVGSPWLMKAEGRLRMQFRLMVEPKVYGLSIESSFVLIPCSQEAVTPRRHIDAQIDQPPPPRPPQTPISIELFEGFSELLRGLVRFKPPFCEALREEGPWTLEGDLEPRIGRTNWRNILHFFWVGSQEEVVQTIGV